MECLNGRATVDSAGAYTLAELWAGSEHYLLRAAPHPPTDTIHLKAIESSSADHRAALRLSEQST